MFKEKRKIKLGSKLFIFAIIALFIYGYILDENSFDDLKNLYSRNKIQNQNNPQNSQEEKTDTPINNANSGHIDPFENNVNQKVITADTKLITKTYDIEKNDIKTEELEIPQELINLTIDEANSYIANNYANWIINEINEKYIEVYKTAEEVAVIQPHFLIKEDSGKIYVFEYNQAGEKKMIKETSIRFDLLSESDQNFFEKGIIKYDMSDVNEILQDFES